MSYAVVACRQCNNAWAVDRRNATASCPHCNAKADRQHQLALWEGEDARAAQAATAQKRAAAGGVHGQQLAMLAAPVRMPRHDSVLDAAAAQVRHVTNKSDRAEAVARWMERLASPFRHEDLIAALERAGLDAKRCHDEVIRLLSNDILLEARPGLYRVIHP
jgi:hypothetical protein